MKRLKFLFGALCAMMLAVACENDSNPEPQIPTPAPENEYLGTVVVDQNDGTTFSKEGVKVTFEVVDEATMDIVMYGVKFAEAMPVTLDMTIYGVEYTETPAGLTLSGDQIVPYAMGGPFEQFTITSLTGEISERGMTLDFVCGAYPVSFEGV